jgi:hypothetical protein
MTRTPSARLRRTTAWVATPVAVVLAGVMVWQGSQAAFTSTTRNSGNAWSTGTVLLTDDDNGVAGFTAEGIVPGDTGSQCIVVTSEANVPGEVRAYVQNLASSRGLEDRITLQIERGTGGSFGDCTGFTPTDDAALPARTLGDLAEQNNSWETGGAPWDTTGTPGESETYRGTWTFSTDGMTQGEIDALQGARVSMDLVWELRSDE